MTLRLALAVGAAGFVGTLARFGCVRLLAPLSVTFPWATYAVNVLGAFVAGFACIWLRRHLPAYELWFPLLMVGFLGAFTTFSTFALESARLFAEGRALAACANLLLQNLSGLLAAALGLILGARC